MEGLAGFCCQFPGDKGPHWFFVGDDAVDKIIFSTISAGIVFFDIPELSAIDPAIHRRPPYNGNGLLISVLFDMGVELIGEKSHDTVCEFVKAHGPEEENNTGLKEKASDVSPDDDPVKAGVIEFDVV